MILDSLVSLIFGQILPFLFVITIVVFFHELGHFWVARRCGVRVDVFSIGFGRSLMQWEDKHGTHWKIGWLPLGGYVKFFGDNSEASTPDKEMMAKVSDADKADIFHFKPLWQRTAVVAAGPFANFILAILIFAGLFCFVGQRLSTPVIDKVSVGSAAERAGMMPGDVILTIDGDQVESFNHVARIVQVSPERDLTFLVDRGGAEVTLVATPQLYEQTDNFGNVFMVGRLGITNLNDPSRVSYVRYDPLTSLAKGVKETHFIITQTFVSLGRIIAGRETADSLGGPIKIAQISGQMASLGFIPILNWIALISVSIGLINLFPIPVLDGGHLLFYAYEAVFGKPMPEKVQEYGMRIGLTLVIMLFIFVTFNDLT